MYTVLAAQNEAHYPQNNCKKRASSVKQKIVAYCAMIQPGTDNQNSMRCSLYFLHCLQACFKDNLVNGRKLINVDASSLPRLGVNDFEHIKVCLLTGDKLIKALIL